VLDCRGAVSSPHLRLGFQKFVGQELRLAAPHGLDAPVIMDAAVPQADGHIASEAVMDAGHCASTVLHMASLPLEANVQFVTVMATTMPFIGRG